MKKYLLATALTAILSTAAQASVITLDTTAFGGSNSFDFDLVQLVNESGLNSASVTQTDTSNDGTLAGVDSFMELGGTSVASFNLDGSQIAAGSPSGFFNPGYNIVFDYQVGGTAQLDVTGDLQVDFNNLVAGKLWVEWDFTGAGGAATQSMDLAIMSLVKGNCDIDSSIGAGGVVAIDSASSCSLTMTALFADGYFTDNVGNDLGQYDENGKNVYIDYDATVTKITGLNFAYSAPGASQTFDIEHTSSMVINVPEPTSLAILGLGLLGFAGTRRRKV
jgi:hypothetical protein